MLHSLPLFLGPRIFRENKFSTNFQNTITYTWLLKKKSALWGLFVHTNRVFSIDLTESCALFDTLISKLNDTKIYVFSILYTCTSSMAFSKTLEFMFTIDTLFLSTNRNRIYPFCHLHFGMFNARAASKLAFIRYWLLCNDDHYWVAIMATLMTPESYEMQKNPENQVQWEIGIMSDLHWLTTVFHHRNQ